MTFRRQYASLPKPLTSEFSAPSGAVCIQVKIPNALVHLYLMQGMLAKLTDADFWDGPDADRKEIAAAWQKAYTETEWGFCVTPSEAGNQTRVSFWHRWDEIVFGNSLTTTVDTAVMWNYYTTMTTPTQGDTREQLVWLPAGDYEIRVLYQRLANNGNLTVLLQDAANVTQATPINAVDIHGTTLRNQVLTGTFSLTEQGMYHVLWYIPSKNAGSTGYNCPLTMTEIWKVSD